MSAATSPAVRAQGPLVWSQETLFLLEPQAAMSWLFRLEQPQDVRFLLRGFGGPQTLRTDIRRWDVEGARWEEAAWVQARSDEGQVVEISRTLEPGYYWLVVSGDGAGEPTPYVLLAECEGEGCASNEIPFTPAVQPLEVSPIIDADRAAVGLTADMRAWLERSRFAGLDLARRGLEGGSYGGRLPGEAQAATGRDPVIFIHGNSDRAIGGPLGGWQRSIEAFREAGYGTGELYATTWGAASVAAAGAQYHSRDNVLHIRAFIEAVLEYTGAERVDIVTHSMGVTLARRAVLGGSASDMAAGGSYEIGAPLTARVDTFVGIAGANRGLVACALTGPSTPTCGATNGLYPGAYLGRGARSQLLRALDAQEGFEGAHVFTIWSPQDEVINAVGEGSLIWGEVTSRIAGQEGELVMEGATHLGSRDESAAAQVLLVTEQRVR